MPAGDIALAFRQYWGATLDTAWLRTSGWPVIHGVARYYASRAQLSPDDGLYHIANTTGPDEQNVNVVDSAFGNCIAKMTLLAAHEGLVATRYEGDAFWDCETWQWPTWLAFFPTVRETNAIFSQTLKTCRLPSQARDKCEQRSILAGSEGYAGVSCSADGSGGQKRQDSTLGG
eukprot:COSAG06_NODE_22755_length_714_cov_0.640650_2_plen_174_part_00